MSDYVGVNPGLEGVVAAATRISLVEGEAGRLTLGGFGAEEIAPQATFEEMTYLLWYSRLPTAKELAEFKSKLVAERKLHPFVIQLLREAAKVKAHPMDALRMAASALPLSHPTQEVSGHPESDALSAVARFPTIVAAYARLLEGHEPVEPRDNLGHAANYLYMLFGKEATPGATRALETYLNVVTDHGLNASTFTARVIMSTRSDVISAVVGAVGALKGPLHGGAPGPALDMVFEIGEVSRAEAYIRAKLATGDRLMGFGHRIYKVRDPRADVLSKAAEELFKSSADKKLYQLARDVETIAIRLLEEHKPGRRLQTNVEYYTALVLHGVGFATSVFTPTFAVGRVVGWTAHCFEQMKETRIMRPTSKYIGESGRKWQPLEARK